MIAIAAASQTAVINTEHVLGTATCEGMFRLVLDVDAMVAGDVAEVRYYKIAVSGGTSQVAGYTMVAGVDGGLPGGAKVLISEPVPNSLTEPNAVQFTLKQTFGTGRAFPYSILKSDTGGLVIL